MKASRAGQVRLMALIVVSVLVALAASTGVASAAGYTAYLFGASSGVTPVALATDTVGGLIPVEAGLGLAPYQLAVTPDGRAAYVAGGHLLGTPTYPTSPVVVPITLATDTPGPPIQVGPNPAGVFITPDGRTALVPVGSDDAFTATHVRPISLATDTTGHPFRIGGCVRAIAFSPDSTTGYAALGDSDPRRRCGPPRVQTFAVASGALGATIRIPTPPTGSVGHRRDRGHP